LRASPMSQVEYIRKDSVIWSLPQRLKPEIKKSH